MSHLKWYIQSHRSQVCSLYKRMLRSIEAFDLDIDDHSLESAKLREKFEKYRHVNDVVVAKRILQEGEKWLQENGHQDPLVFPCDPNGVAYQRLPRNNDEVLDRWSPAEKSRYPDYFTRREELKDDFRKLWESDFGREPVEDDLQKVYEKSKRQ